MELSERLRAVAGMVTRGNTAADAGCDHGYTAIWLVSQGICPKVAAMDVGRGPLERAKAHIREAGLSDYINTRLSDGVEALAEGEADSLILAGMGGRLIVKILTDGGRKVRGMKEVIVQPQSEIGMVRRFLRENGFLTAEEDMVLEDGKYYQMMRALPAAAGMKSAGDGYGLLGEAVAADRLRLYERYGKLLLNGRHPVLLSFLYWQQEQYRCILEEIRKQGSAGAEKRKRELAEEQELIKEALCYFEGGSSCGAVRS